ncbi:MAG: hypothetical protein EXS35_19080 [Pedosphaera sp.]|nr:hypothetical protein [Pedosphaera sp.]
MDTPERHPQVVLAKGGAWHEPELIRRRYTSDSLAKARRTFGILAWRDRFGGWHYPKWQFDEDGKVLPQVVEILRLFRSSDVLYVMSQFLFAVAPDKALIELIGSGRGDKAVTIATKRVREISAEPKLSRKQLDELRLRMNELRDPARYVVVSSLLPGWAMVYDVANNVYCHQHVSEGCLIKDRTLADAIAQQLGTGRRNSDLHVLSVRKTKAGYRALENLPARRSGKPWRPRFRVSRAMPVFVPITASGTRESFVDAMVFAAQHREELLRLFAQCPDRKFARAQLVKKCRVSPQQAEAILEMRLHMMTRKSVEELVDELRAAVGVG